LYVFFFHFQAVIMTIDAVVGPTEEKMIRLLKFLSDTIIITPDMMERVKNSNIYSKIFPLKFIKRI
jgi:hypothetical protein